MMHHYGRFVVRIAAAVVAVIVLSLMGPQTASAAVQDFQAFLDGLQVVPPNASPAFGSATFQLNTVSGAVTVTNGIYQDLLGGATGVSLNGMAAPGTNAPVLVALTLDTPGAATGTFSGSGTLGVMAIGGMQAGNTYVIIRSSVFPSGEIRAQLEPVPEPASITLAIFSASGLATCARRRKALARRALA